MRRLNVFWLCVSWKDKRKATGVDEASSVRLFSSFTVPLELMDLKLGASRELNEMKKRDVNCVSIFIDFVCKLQKKCCCFCAAACLQIAVHKSIEKLPESTSLLLFHQHIVYFHITNATDTEIFSWFSIEIRLNRFGFVSFSKTVFRWKNHNLHCCKRKTLLVSSAIGL